MSSLGQAFVSVRYFVFHISLLKQVSYELNIYLRVLLVNTLGYIFDDLFHDKVGPKTDNLMHRLAVSYDGAEYAAI